MSVASARGQDLPDNEESPMRVVEDSCSGSIAARDSYATDNIEGGYLTDDSVDIIEDSFEED